MFLQLAPPTGTSIKAAAHFQVLRPKERAIILDLSFNFSENRDDTTFQLYLEPDSCSPLRLHQPVPAAAISPYSSLSTRGILVKVGL